MYKTEGGVLALYRGIIPTVAGVAPYVSVCSEMIMNNINQHSIGWTEFHDLRVCTKVPDPGGRKESFRCTKAGRWCHLWSCSTNMHISFVSQKLSAIWSIELIQSSDVLRRRFQINTMSGIGYQYKSIWDAIKIIVSQEGVRGLYKGLVPNLLKVAPSMASSWLSFELTRDMLISFRQEES